MGIGTSWVVFIWLGCFDFFRGGKIRRFNKKQVGLMVVKSLLMATITTVKGRDKLYIYL